MLKLHLETPISSLVGCFLEATQRNSGVVKVLGF
jgi:hypothetical protein